MGDALERYFDDNSPNLRPRTLATYKRTTDAFALWCDGQRITPDTLALSHLVAFRAHLSKAPLLSQAKGAKRGARKAKSKPRSGMAVNVHVRSLKVVLNYLRRLGLLPRLDRDAVSDGLRILATPKPSPTFMRSADLKALLAAALAHDTETFRATRSGEKDVPRYPAIAPFVTVAILTGMRLGELIGLDWSEVDLPEQKIRLGVRVKTKTSRDMDLAEVSPGLVKYLQAMHGRAGEPNEGPVFGLSEEEVRAAQRRLNRYLKNGSFSRPKESKDDAASSFSWQQIRRTVGTFLTNSPGIFGSASAYRSARFLGHGVSVAERFYLGLITIPKDATTLEAAMGIESLIEQTLGDG